MEEGSTAHFKWHGDLGWHQQHKCIMNVFLCSAWSTLNKPCKLLSIQAGIWLMLWNTPSLAQLCSLSV